MDVERLLSGVEWSEAQSGQLEVLTLDIHIDVVAGHCSLCIRCPAHVLAMRRLCDALQDERLIGDDDSS